jgi:acyl-CoA reductase-like NAD-dependent aldehyde dehydrogenase
VGLGWRRRRSARCCHDSHAGRAPIQRTNCTSINGAFIHPAVFDAVSQQLGVLWKDLTAGDPRTENVDVGPLLDELKRNGANNAFAKAAAKSCAAGHGARTSSRRFW